jgi:hypothetical protein
MCITVSAGVRAGHWFTVKVQDGITTLQHRPDLLQRAEPVICAFDIETTKLPLRFPNSAHDQVGAGKHCAVLTTICWYLVSPSSHISARPS